MAKKAALRNRRAQYLFIGDRGNTWKTLRYYSFPPFLFFIHKNKKIFPLFLIFVCGHSDQ